MEIVLVDFEMNPINREYKAERKIAKNEIIEIGAVKVDDACNITSRFRCYVKPQLNTVQKNITRLTGITDDDVADAPFFKEALENFMEWIGKDKTKIYSWSNTDKEQLFNEAALKLSDGKDCLLPTFRRWIDLQKIFSRLMGFDHPVKLVNALGILKVDFNGVEHSALIDAENSADLLILLRNKEKFTEIRAKNHITYNSKQMNSFTLGDMIKVKTPKR